jgi:hypothetical protein
MDSPHLALTADSSDGTMRANAGRFPSPVPRRRALHRKAARACVDGRGKSAALESVMEARIDEIADGIYRLSTFFPDVVPPAGFTFNQFLVSADEPLLFHCGLRAMFPSSLAAVGRLLPVERLRWVTFGHFEADECGSMNDWLAVAPQARPWRNRLRPLDCRRGRPTPARSGRRRGTRPRRQAHTLHRYPACAARVGCRRGPRGDDRDPALRRPFCACRQRPAGYPGGHSRTRDPGRGNVPVHQPWPDHCADNPQVGGSGAAHIGSHARLVVLGRRCRRSPLACRLV